MEIKFRVYLKNGSKEMCALLKKRCFREKKGDTKYDLEIEYDPIGQMGKLGNVNIKIDYDAKRNSKYDIININRFESQCFRSFDAYDYILIKSEIEKLNDQIKRIENDEEVKKLL